MRSAGTKPFQKIKNRGCASRQNCRGRARPSAIHACWHAGPGQRSRNARDLQLQKRSMSGKKKSPPLNRKRILVLDDHPMMRQGLAQLIGNEGDLSVCGEAENANEAIGKINSLKPDLLLADITLP